MPDSVVCTTLLGAVTSGTHISAITDIARAIAAEMDNVPESVLGLASLGAFGKHPSHAERDLTSWLQNIFDCQLEKYYLFLDLDLTDRPEPLRIKIPCIIPFELLHSLHLQGNMQFHVSVLGDEGQRGLVKFWEQALKEDWAQKHPIVQKHAPEDMVPITVHLDGCEMHSNAEYYVFSFGSILVQASNTHVMESRLPTFVIPHCIMKLPGTKEKVMKLYATFMSWCMDVFDSKVMPSRGFYFEEFPQKSARYKMKEQPIMGNFVAVFTGAKADGKARVEVNRFDRWWKCKEMCDSCLATNPQYSSDDPTYAPRSYANFRMDAGWRSTLETHDMYMANTKKLSPMCIIPGWRKELVLRDIAHMDEMGFGRDLGAGIIKSLHKRKELGTGSLDEQLQHMIQELQAERKARGLPKLAGTLTKSMLGLDNMSEYPEFKSSIKAKRVTILNKFLCRKAVKLAEDSTDPGDTICALRGTMAWSYLQMHELLENADLFLTDDEASRYRTFVSMFLQALSKLCRVDKRFIWKYRPKHHQVDHMADEILGGSRLNPLKISCLLEEDFLGKMKMLGKSIRGSTPLHAMDRFIDRWLWNIGLRWHRRKRSKTFRIACR